MRGDLLNDPKHNGQYPEPDAFQRIFPNVRTLMLYFVDPNGAYNLKSIADVGANGAWQDLFASSDYFRPQGACYSYILLTDEPLNPALQKEMFRVPWSLVMDFNPDSSRSGSLLYEYISANTARQPIMHTLSVHDSNSEITYSSAPHWLQLNGNPDDPSESQMDDRTLSRRKIQRYLRSFLVHFYEKYARPAVDFMAVFCYIEDVENYILVRQRRRNLFDSK